MYIIMDVPRICPGGGNSIVFQLFRHLKLGGTTFERNTQKFCKAITINFLT